MTRVYLYTVYERIWHWTQAAVLMLLLLTGMEIHAPETVSVLGFGGAVKLHAVLGFLLLANAFLGLFYHLTTGAIRQFLPEPRDFLSLAAKLVAFYLRGIFRGDPHPMERGPGAKLNPLQKVTYLAILNILLPLQIFTGLLMWGAQELPGLHRALGGLPFLAPLHTLVAWLFGAFVVLHVYLTTTGTTPLGHIRAMITGWEEVDLAQRDSKGPGTAGAARAPDTAGTEPGQQGTVIQET